MCACHRLLLLKPTGLESGLQYFRIGCSEEQITGCQTNLLKEPILSLQRNRDYWCFLYRRETFNAVNSQSSLCIFYVCSESMNTGVIFSSNTRLQSIWFLWIVISSSWRNQMRNALVHLGQMQVKLLEVLQFQCSLDSPSCLWLDSN